MKVEVHLQGGIRKVVEMNPTATNGAIVGKNLYLQDGTLVTEEMLSSGESVLQFSLFGPISVEVQSDAYGTYVLQLVGDIGSPGNTSGYRTNGSGAKGWYPLADAFNVGADELTKSVGGDGITTFGLADVTPTAGGSILRVAFDAKGRRSQEDTATTTDLPEGTNLYYTDTRADARITLQKGQPNGLATLDSGSKIPGNQLPDLAITETFVVASQAAMLALTAQPGDVAVRTDVSKSFILTASPASTLANWQELLSPTGTGGTVTSVNLTSTTGLTASGGPVTISGSLTYTLSANLQAWHALATSSKANSSLTITTIAPITGGGNLTANRTFSIDLMLLPVV